MRNNYITTHVIKTGIEHVLHFRYYSKQIRAGRVFIGEHVCSKAPYELPSHNVEIINPMLIKKGNPNYENVERRKQYERKKNVNNTTSQLYEYSVIKMQLIRCLLLETIRKLLLVKMWIIGCFAFCTYVYLIMHLIRGKRECNPL